MVTSLSAGMVNGMRCSKPSLEKVWPFASTVAWPLKSSCISVCGPFQCARQTCVAALGSGSHSLAARRCRGTAPVSRARRWGSALVPPAVVAQPIPIGRLERHVERDVAGRLRASRKEPFVLRAQRLPLPGEGVGDALVGRRETGRRRSVLRARRPAAAAACTPPSDASRRAARAAPARRPTPRSAPSAQHRR